MEREVPYVGIPAKWSTDGPRRAGPIRNRYALELERPGFVLGFPSEGTGTADMLQAALAAGVECRRVDEAGRMHSVVPLAPGI